ncbi:hypothetical protein D5086_022049 [Populus alba]|uniref:Uncharacterized protein n=1 Tax=Populus alba TaxID=43335 RepID=A0ACC4BEF2_POPAL
MLSIMINLAVHLHYSVQELHVVLVGGLCMRQGLISRLELLADPVGEEAANVQDEVRVPFLSCLKNAPLCIIYDSRKIDGIQLTVLNISGGSSLRSDEHKLRYLAVSTVDVAPVIRTPRFGGDAIC